MTASVAQIGDDQRPSRFGAIRKRVDELQEQALGRRGLSHGAQRLGELEGGHQVLGLLAHDALVENPRGRQIAVPAGALRSGEQFRGGRLRRNGGGRGCQREQGSGAQGSEDHENQRGIRGTSARIETKLKMAARRTSGGLASKFKNPNHGA